MTDSGSSYVYLISIIAAVGGFLFGYDLSIISGAVLFLNKEFSLTSVQLGLLVGCASLGCIPGPLVAAGISDRIGFNTFTGDHDTYALLFVCRADDRPPATPNPPGP